MRRFFSYDPADGVTRFHDTAQLARESAREALQAYRDLASDEGWVEDEVALICWGEVKESAVRTICKQRPPDELLDESGCDAQGNNWNGPDGLWDEIWDFDLKPLKTKE